MGDDAPVPLIERPWVQDLRAEKDGRHAVARLCHEVAQLFRRVAPLHVAIRAATGDADVARLLEQDQRSRYATLRHFVAILAGKPGFNPELGEERAADIVYGILSESVYLLFCGDREWTLEAWTDWCVAILSSQLFPPPSPTT